MIVKDDSNALSINGPDLFIRVDVTVKSEHVEQHIDGQDWVSTCMEKASLHLLFLDFVALEEAGFHVDKVQRFLVLALLSEHFKIETDEFAIYIEVWLLHQFQQEQIRDIEDLSLKA